MDRLQGWWQGFVEGFFAASQAYDGHRRHTYGMGVPAGTGFGMRKIVSWLAGDWNGWGSQSKLDAAESLDEDHRAAALRTGPKGSCR
jgi:hypothetical protein